MTGTSLSKSPATVLFKTIHTLTSILDRICFGYTFRSAIKAVLVKSSITTPSVQKTHISSVTVDLNFKNNYRRSVFYFIEKGGREGRGEGFAGTWSIFRARRKYQ